MNRILIYVSLLIAVICIGFAAIFIRLADAPGIISAFYRMFIATVAFSPVALFEIFKRRKSIKIQGILYALLAGAFFGIDLSFWSTGVVLSGATMPTLFANMAPLWVGIGSIILFKEKQKWLFWLGLMIALTGALMVFQNDFSNTEIEGKGTLLGFIAAIFYSAFFFVASEGRKYVNTIIFFWFSTLGSCIVLLVSVLINNYNLSGYDVNTYLYFLGLGLGVQIIGWLLVNNVQGHLPATLVAPTLLGQPIATAILAVFLLHDEKLGFWHLAGGVVVLSGIFLVHYGKSR